MPIISRKITQSANKCEIGHSMALVSYAGRNRVRGLAGSGASLVPVGAGLVQCPISAQLVLVSAPVVLVSAS